MSEAAEKSEASGAAPEFECVSRKIRFDLASRTISVKRSIVRADEEPWADLGVQYAWMPASPLHPAPTKLVEHDQLFWLLVVSLDCYAAKQKGSKTFHTVVTDICRTLVKTFEYLWIEGFYDPRDAPEAVWQKLRTTLARGSWNAALRTEQRAINFVADNPNTAANYIYRNWKGKISLRDEFREALGTNIAGLETRALKSIVVQATSKRDDDDGRYKFGVAKQMSETMLIQTLRAHDLLGMLPERYRVKTIPRESASGFAQENGRKGNRTENIEPEVWAKVLVHAYKWIYDFGPFVVEAVRVIAIHLEPYFSTEMRLRADANESVASYRASLMRRALPKITEVQALSAAIGLEITNYSRKENPDGETSVNAVLNQLLSSCFIVIASMNARRKDEVSGRAVGIYAGALKQIDPHRDVYECDFYVEKTVQDYVPFLVNNVSATAIQLVDDVAEVAWFWREAVNEQQGAAGRERKVFFLPGFVGGKKGKPIWFEFDANQDEPAQAFIRDALGELASQFKVKAHMFRRGYGLLYHYRYENATLVALSQKYGHLDLNSTRHYITNGTETELGKTAAAKWALPSNPVQRAQLDQRKEMQAEIEDVGLGKLENFVRDVIGGARTFGGGFSKLVARYHRILSARVDYDQMSLAAQAKSLMASLVDRGHTSHPLKTNTCWAGRNRKHAACGVKKEAVARENASAMVCSRCPYSETNEVQLKTLERDLAFLSSHGLAAAETVKGRAAIQEQENLRRVIVLHRLRLGLDK
ncbi:hypothetical protein [Pseudorhodoferax soli]|uniref:Phage integrase family protein n=1 Tax=Pseudorhodoferax soli TaxID=545864 RepID=A0A368XK67_9BURK|nr:hypothetical protein [Pseudorhodoferax soli]RCW66877.1 hypothetical protein DES41_110242 [Pseudorhodoferax soli]